MSTVAPRPPAPPANPALLDSERYIDDHISRTRRALKLADFSAGVIVLVAGVLAFLLVAGVIDHWIIPGGLGPAGRLALFGLLVLGVGWHAWRRFVPLLRPINPVYAAHTIEKSSPTLKNSLLNVILFRGHRQQMSAKVFHALEQQAAQRLSAAPAEASVDHAALLRLGYALLAVVAACTLYAVLSPKNLAVSAIRIIDPWADVSAPSRVKILNVEPGATSVARGERVAISAEVHAIGEDEPVRLRYSTDDEQLVDETITMTRPVGATRFTADLPRATDSNRAAGVMNNLEYWIEAGDARSPRFKLSVFDRPTIVVQRVEYHAPAYTGEPSRSVDNVGDIRGLEGTTVAIEALANQSIRAAYVDFDADGTNDLKMAIDGERATAGFELKLRPDRRTPLHNTYVLRYTTTEGRSNSDPTQYSIDVTPDYAPEVRLTKPEEPEVTVRVGDTVQLGAEARDPDYALSQVRVMGRVGEKDLTVVDMPLKDGRGRFTGSRMFTPADAGLKPGDVLEYWAEARDNRRPEPNIGMSEHRRMRIVAADAPGGAQQQQNNRGGGQQQQGEGQNQGQGGENKQGGAQQQGEEDGGEGEAGGQGQQGGAAGGQGKSEQGQDSDSGEAASAAGQSGGENSEPGAEGAQGEQSGQGGSQSENGEQSNEQQGAEGTEGGAGGEQSQQENGQAGENPSGNKPGEHGAAGRAQGGQQEKVSADGDDDPTAFERIREHMGAQEGESGSHGGEGEQQAGQQQVGEQQAGEQQQGEQQQGAQQPGEQQNAAGENPRAGESGSGTERRGANENANDQSADNPSAGELADGKPGEGEAATEQGKPGANGSKKPSGDGKGNSEGVGETPAGADGALNENNGKSPAGDNASGAPGAPEATTKRDRDGKPGDEGESAAEGEPPTDHARGKDESHARGDQSGDRSGSGQKGGGQQADNAGQGEAGSHTASDTGAGQSEDQGAGETGTEAGDEQLADGKTGESSGNKPGAGSESGDAEGPQQPPGGEDQAGDEQQSGKTAGEQQQGAGGQQGGSSEQQSESDAGKQGEQGQAGQAGQNGGQSAGDEAQGEAPGEQQSGAQAGGSPPGEGTNDPSDPTEGDQQGAGRGGAASAPPTHGGTQGGGVSGNNGGGEPGGDKANLDFARRQVDLVLEKLDDQLEQHKVDPKLLKSLGWTEDELRRFVTRWQGLKARAAAGGDDAADANAQLDAALRSLGLRQNGPQRFRAGATADKLRDLNDAYRARAPQEYLDRVREYTKGVSAADEE